MPSVAHKSAPELHKPEIPGHFVAKMWFCYAGIFAVAAIAIGLDNQKFVQMWNWPAAAAGGPSQVAFFVVRLILFGELLLVAYRWIDATSNEAEMWVEWLDYKQQPREALRAMCALSLFLGIMLAFADRIVFITLFYSVCLLLNYYTQWFCNKEAERAILRARGRYAGDTRRIEILDAMEHFWVTLPQLARITTIMFFSCIAFALALAGQVQSELARTHFQIAAYVVLIADILIGEVVIFVWRRDLEREIDRA